MWREELTMLETRTLGILPPRDVDELLDVANLLGLRHMNDDQTRARSLQDEQGLAHHFGVGLVPVGAVVRAVVRAGPAECVPGGCDRIWDCTVYGVCRINSALSEIILQTPKGNPTVSHSA